ncbi:hypothetical protein L0U85_12015 [Glycomyces sp. L485]|uniref:hypothetical protein n=1 Tax=Glycomyces sp. L485 TaxID=2909235 RepID=UPI001F4A1EA5|nr:hypothetical protein [Glycomyces sp. L485]MCH7231570.1 hypothetical protein [Glycomyces sp. L485]
MEHPAAESTRNEGRRGRRALLLSAAGAAGVIAGTVGATGAASAAGAGDDPYSVDVVGIRHGGFRPAGRAAIVGGSVSAA